MRIQLFVAGLGLLLPYWVGNLLHWVPAALGVALLLSFWRALRSVLVLVLALAYSSYQVQFQVQQQISGCDKKLPVRVWLEIQEVQPAGDLSTRLVAVVRGLEATNSEPKLSKLAPRGHCHAQVNQRYRLTWRSAPPLAVGSLWQMDLVLSEPWGYQNPGGFDYERWLLGADLAATGYVRTGELVTAAPAPQGIDRWRAKLATELAHYAQSGILQALVLGDVSKLSGDDWQRLRISGTVHLFVVSGLHVGLVASAGFFATNWLLRLLPWVIARVPAQRLAVTGALSSRAVDVLLAGGNVPGVRAWLMLALALVWLGCGRRVEPLLGFLWALIIVLICLPRSGWQLGFYLSFGAVGVLLCFFAPRRAATISEPSQPLGWCLRLAVRFGVRLKQLVQMQLALLLGMGPLTLALGLATPSLGLLVNLAAVPWVSLVVVPMALVGAILTQVWASLGHLLLGGADLALALFGHLLQAASVGALWQPPSLAWWAHGVHALVGLLCLVPMAWRIRLLVLLAYVSVFLNWQPRLPKGDFRVLVMDVGQGSAILVSTAQHHLLFDTGPAYDSGFSAAEALIEPSFGALSVGRLDALVVSHSDLDHAGGAHWMVKRWLPKLNLKGGLAKNIEPPFTPCVAGQQWVWDQVEFRMLNPLEPGQRRSGITSNDASCVLQISAAAGSSGLQQRALLLGDISQAVELSLLGAMSHGVTLMTAPHHGSATSSSRAMVRRLHPQWVVVSASRHSRYGHPHADVVDRYCEVGAGLFVTGEVGAIDWRSDQPRNIYLTRTGDKPWRQAQLPSKLGRCGQ